MAYYIEVNYKTLESTAKDIEDFLSDLTSEMQSAGSAVTSLSNSWSGKDYNALLVQWQSAEGTGSTYRKMKESLDSYAKYLRYAAGKYKTAQTDAVNRADFLKWF